MRFRVCARLFTILLHYPHLFVILLLILDSVITDAMIPQLSNSFELNSISTCIWAVAVFFNTNWMWSRWKWYFSSISSKWQRLALNTRQKMWLDTFKADITLICGKWHSAFKQTINQIEFHTSSFMRLMVYGINTMADELKTRKIMENLVIRLTLICRHESIEIRICVCNLSLPFIPLINVRFAS